jgi:hypothetical protein
MKFRQFVPEYNAIEREVIEERDDDETNEKIALLCQVATEENFVQNRRPFYRVYPGVTDALIRLGNRQGYSYAGGNGNFPQTNRRTGQEIAALAHRLFCDSAYGRRAFGSCCSLDQRNFRQQGLVERSAARILWCRNGGELIVIVVYYVCGMCCKIS